MSYHHEIAEQDYILSVLVQNNSGVLLRIAGLFSRRGYNIQSIVAAKTKDEMHGYRNKYVSLYFQNQKFYLCR